MKNLKILTVLTLVLLTTGSVWGQMTEMEARQLMWDSGDPDFEVTETPEKWNGESAVIICKSMRMEYRKQLLAARINNDYYLRQRIKLLDKSAVDEYSKFSFDKLGNESLSREAFFAGIKVVKPDGTEREIDLNEAVEMQKYTNSKERRKLNAGYNKIAIPGLEIGDIIDYYMVSINATDTKTQATYRYEFDPVFFVLPEKYPLMKGKISFLPERRCYINIDASNGAPVPVVKNDGQKEFIEVTYADQERIKSSLWTFPYLQEPMIKWQVVMAPAPPEHDERYFLGEPEVPKSEVSYNEFIRLLKILTRSSYSSDNGLVKPAKRFLKKYRISDDPQTLVNDLYYYFRHHLFFHTSVYNFPLRYYYDRFDVIQAFSGVLQDEDIDHTVFLATPRSMGVIDSVLLLNEVIPGIEVDVNGTPVYITSPGGHEMCGEGMEGLENTTVFATRVTSKSKGIQLVRDTIAASRADENLQFDSLYVRLPSEGDDSLDVFHRFTVGGHLKSTYQNWMIRSIDYFPDEYNRFSTISIVKNSELSSLDGMMADIQEDRDKIEKRRNEDLQGWLATNYDLENANIKKFRLLRQGRFDENPEMMFDLQFKAPDVLQRSGNYMIVNAGKLIGLNIDLTPEEKDRKEDVYMPFARRYDWKLVLEVPSGYAVKTTDNFVYDVSNGTGGFRSKVSRQDDQLVIEASKWYNHDFEPLVNWPDMLEVLEAANDFVQQKLVLVKED